MPAAATAAPPGGAIALDGPNAFLPPSAVSVLGLLLNELATNATKHGALRPSGGLVELSWSIVDGNGADGGNDAGESAAARWDTPVLVLDWTEQVNEPIVPVRSEDDRPRGTGHQIAERLLAAADGTLDFDLSGGAMRARIVLPIAGATPAVRHQGTDRMPKSMDGSGRSSVTGSDESDASRPRP